MARTVAYDDGVEVRRGMHPAPSGLPRSGRCCACAYPPPTGGCKRWRVCVCAYYVCAGVQKRDEDEQVGYSTCVWPDSDEGHFFRLCGLTGMCFGSGEVATHTLTCWGGKEADARGDVFIYMNAYFVCVLTPESVGGF
jgi:hypothetical protein